MQKIMFNDRCGLTQAVMEGRKTMTRRRVCKPDHDEVFDNSVDRFNKGWIDHVELIGSKRAYAYKPRYKVGEIVAVAQSYNDIVKSNLHFQTRLVGNDVLGGEPACKNKMFVKADLMPHQIRILDVRAEKLQDITEEDCLRAGVVAYTKDEVLFKYGFKDIPRTWVEMPRSPREAYALLIDKISGKGTWNRNPWVWVYEFELVK